MPVPAPPVFTIPPVAPVVPPPPRPLFTPPAPVLPALLSATSAAAGGTAGTVGKAVAGGTDVQLVWTDEEFSMEERRAQLPRYALRSNS